MPPQCQHVREDGSRCRGSPPAGSQFCFAHHPDREAERREARSAGGKARSRVVLPDEAEDLPARTPQELAVLLEATIADVRKGRLDAKVGSTVGYLVSVQLRILQGEDWQERVVALERALQSRNQERRGKAS